MFVEGSNMEKKKKQGRQDDEDADGIEADQTGMCFHDGDDGDDEEEEEDKGDAEQVTFVERFQDLLSSIV